MCEESKTPAMDLGEKLVQERRREALSDSSQGTGSVSGCIVCGKPWVSPRVPGVRICIACEKEQND